MPLAYADRSFEQLFRFELPNARQAVLTVNQFYWREKAQFYDFTRDAFARMKAAGTQTLVIDIRANSGGDDDMWLEGLMPYLADKPYRNGSDYVLKIIEGRQKEGQKVGDVVRGSQSTYQPALDNPLRFTGKVYVLIGPYTYSSAILFSNAVQDYGFATVVGTGGAARATQSGGTQNVKLSHTQIGLVVPRFLLKRPSGAAGLLQPDILVPDDPFRPATAIEALLRL
jgi:C-terminal processing protease CtpA/Prc